MRSETRKFLLDIKIMYVDWLREHADCFPYCCFLSTEILTSYVQVHFSEGEAVAGDWRSPLSGGGTFDIPHAWTRIGETIIDFTYMQFEMEVIETYEEEYIDVPTEELLTLANKLEDHIFVQEEQLKSLYRIGCWDDAISDPSFKKEAEDVDFKTYLKRLELTIQRNSETGKLMFNEKH